MRAVLMERGELRVEDIPQPQPQAGEVLVSSQACGICGSDLHAAKHTDTFVATSRETGGAFQLTTFKPVVMGHEFCAEIVEHGPHTEKKLPTGQLVCSVPMLARSTPTAVGYSDQVPGGFAQLMLLSERLLIPVPAGVPAASAALTEPMAVGLHAVNKAQLRGDEALVVIGAGPVGLAVITAAKAAGHGPIVAADFTTGRRRYAAQQGADLVCDPAVDNPLAQAELKGRDVVVFECVGVPGVLDNLFTQVPQNTRIVVVGVCLQSDSIRPLVAINKELAIQFVLGYSFKEFTASLHNIADGKFAVADLISHTISLDEVADTFSALEDPQRYAKVVVNPQLAGKK